LGADGLSTERRVSRQGEFRPHIAVAARGHIRAANIAEGFRKRGPRDKLRFFNIAQGSLEESRYFLILARDLGYADVRETALQLEEVSRLLEAYSGTILNSGF